MTNAILQNDIFCPGRINVFSNATGDIIGWVTPELKAITMEGANPDFVFSNLQAAVKYIVAVTQPKIREIKREDKTQITLNF